MTDTDSNIPTLSVGAWTVSTDVNGPGRRFVLWLQGCNSRCKGCFNPEFQDFVSGMRLSSSDIGSLVATAQGIEGVTLSGGEPFLQIQSLIPLIRRIRSGGLSIVCYTGYRFEELVSGALAGATDLLKLCDILIDGQFCIDQKAPLRWRGSNNQRIYYLTDRYCHLEHSFQEDNIRRVELIHGGGSLTMTGSLESELWEKLQHRLRKGS